MLQQDDPGDFVIAAVVQYSRSQFIEKAASELCNQIRWEGLGANKVGYWDQKAIVRIDPLYYRPIEVETLLLDPPKAKMKLGWVNEISLDEKVQEIMAIGLAETRKIALLKSNGYKVAISTEYA
jgi:GDPmannose 4,6-dehydratase